MDTFNFTPTQDESHVAIPFFEDAKADYAPYYSSTKTIKKVKAEIGTEMGKLDASIRSIQDGYFGIEQKRYGYKIQFVYHGLPGTILVAGLPIRKETPRKIDRVRVQALLNVRDWLKTSITQPIFSPGSHPLIMHLLMPGTNQTVTEYLISTGNLALPTGEDQEIVDGQFS